MPTFQEIIYTLTRFWEKQGCIIHFGHDVETGAGTFNPATFLRALGPEPYSAAFVEPSRRPSDGRYGENPNRLQLFHQFQVLIKPSPANIMDLYKKSLEVIGIDLSRHDLRFVHDDWESPTLGAYGLGWEVWLDGMEVTQFTYFQGLANTSLESIPVELTYGLERLCMHVQNKDDFFSMQWSPTHTYGEICKQQEVEWSAYNFTYSSPKMWQRHFEDFEKEAKDLIAHNLPLPAYDFVMKASHAFNMLDARGVISVTERTGYIARIRDLSRLIAQEYIEQRKALGFPLCRDEPETPHIPKAKAALQSFDPYRRETFLLEIGSEELPATFVPIGIQNLEKGLRTLFSEHYLSFERIEMFGTPRRLGALIHGLVEGSPDQDIKRKGPKVAAAFKEGGTLSPQGMGFLKGLGLDVCPTLDQVEASKIHELSVEGEYLFAHVKKPGRSVYSILSEQLGHLITSLDFPKKMRWSALPIAYARPLKWITALYADHLVPFVVGTISSTTHSFGHSQLSKEKIPLPNANAYFSLMEKHYVQPVVEKRKAAILQQLHAVEKELNAKAVEQPQVLDQVVHLSEWPQLTTSTFSKDFLKLPKEVLISEMVEHQKYFPLQLDSQDLIDTFVIVADNTPNDTIRHGNQKVLSARLSDGAFLFQEDMKHPLSHFHERLCHITFQKDLGSLLDKVERLTSVAERLNHQLKLADQTKVNRAAFLCKADLASEMVKEFPELQGTIGKSYALLQKEDEEVACAIEEHWMPRFEGAELPKTATGIILSLADKVDNLNSYFAVGLKPTSSSDPYGLRRQAIGLVKILIQNQLSLDLSHFVPKEALAFLSSRAQVVFEDEGFSKDEIAASVLAVCNDPYDQYCKLHALRSFRNHPAFEGLLEVYKRATGQLAKGTPAQFDLSLAHEKAEKNLYQALQELNRNWKGLLTEKNYTHAFEEIAKLQAPLAHLFDTVKILAEDPLMQKNRLSLLQEVVTPIEDLLDLSKLQR